MQGLSGRKRKRNNGRVVEKPKEVIHVRAKRGQATDSHSLAERVCIYHVSKYFSRYIHKNKKKKEFNLKIYIT